MESRTVLKSPIQNTEVAEGPVVHMDEKMSGNAEANNGRQFETTRKLRNRDDIPFSEDVIHEDVELYCPPCCPNLFERSDTPVNPLNS